MLKIAKHIFNAFLVLFLGAQSYLLAALVIHGFWQVPRWLVDSAIFLFNESDAEIEVESIRYYPRKGIVVEGINIFSHECVCPVIQIGNVHLKLLKDKQTHQHTIEGLVRKGVVYFPDQFIPEEENLRLIENLGVEFRISDDFVELEHFRANVSKLKIFSTNTIRLPVDVFEDDSLSESEPLEENSSIVLDKIRQMRYIHHYFEDSDGADLRLSFYYDLIRGFSGDFSLFSKGSRFEENVVTKSLYLQGQFDYEENFSLRDGVFGELESLRYGNDFRMEGVKFRASYSSEEFKSLLPDEIRLSASAFDVQGRKFDFINVLARPTSMDTGAIEAQAGVIGQSIGGCASYDLERKNAVVHVEGDFNPLKLVESGWLGKDVDTSLVQLENTPYLKGDCSIQDWKYFEDLGFEMVAENVVLKGAAFDYARGVGSFENKVFVLDEFGVAHKNYVLRGSLSKNLETTDFAYTLSGEGLPTDLNTMFKDWWRNTWVNFDFYGNPAKVDIDIWGKNDDYTKRFSYGKMSFKGTSYKGLHIDEGSVRLASFSKLTSLFDMDIHHALGDAAGEFMTVFNPRGKGVVSQRLDFYTDVPLREIAPIVGDSLNVYSENTNDEFSPQVWVKGCIVKDGQPQYEHLEELDIKIVADEPFEFFGVGLDSLEADVLKKDGKVEVFPANFTFSDGIGTGKFVLNENEENPVLQFEASVVDFDYRIAEEKIRSIREAKEKARKKAVAKGKKVEEKKYKGRSFMDVTLAGSFPLGDWSGLQASGAFELDDPLIHRVHVFGGFSKMMDNAELNLGSFSLKRAESPILVTGKKIELTDLVLSGPSSRVKSKGSINLDTGTLDFRLKAYPLREVKFPVVAGLALILRPFSQMFEVKVSGPLEDPEWKMVIDPSGL